MLEVLVALLGLSFGLLGMVGMQAASLQSNRDARLQSSAVLLTRELADMMRGNKSVSVKTSDNPYLGSFSSPLTSPHPSYCLNVGLDTARCTVSTSNRKRR